MKPSQEEATRKMLATLWNRNLPILRSRVDEIEQAATSATSGKLTPEARASAGSTSHKLAGSLGMFGYPHGTEIARELELMLDGKQGELDSGKLTELAQALRAELPL